MNLNELNDHIYDVFRHHGFENFPHSRRLLLAKFYLLLMEAQEFHNSTRLRTVREVAIKHYIDCLIIPQLTQLEFPLLDMGSGAGFPGIPLKIIFPGERIILAEGVQKRVEFLKKVRDELELENLDIIGRQVNADFVYPVRGVITRAVMEVSETLSRLTGCLQTGGIAYLMKGPNVDPEIENAAVDWEKIFRLKQDVAYELPKTPHRRRLLLYEKARDC